MNPPNPREVRESRRLATLPQSLLCTWDLQRDILEASAGDKVNLGPGILQLM